MFKGNARVRGAVLQHGYREESGAHTPPRIASQFGYRPLSRAQPSEAGDLSVRRSATNAPRSSLQSLFAIVAGSTYRPCHWHFHRQLLHRYGVVLAPGGFSAIVIAIRDSRARLIERQANGRAVYSVRVPSVGDRVFVPVSGARNVVTALRSARRLKGIRQALLSLETNQ